MPGGFPIGPEICNGQHVGFNAAANRGTAFSGGTNTYGAWAQIKAATDYDACWLVAHLAGDSFANFQGSYQIGVGASGDERIVAADMIVAYVAPQTPWVIPCSIPAGSRIAARGSATVGTVGFQCSLQLFDGAFTQMEGAAGVDSIGYVPSTTRGTQIDPGAVAFTKSAFVQLTASTPRDYMGIFVNADPLDEANGIPSGIVALDVAIGGAGSEQIIIPDYPFPLGRGILKPSPIFSIAIPAGTRLSARASSSNTAASNRFGLIAYGIYR